MSNNGNTEATSAGDEVLKAIGGLGAATSSLKDQAGKDCGLTGDEAVGILTIIGRALLGIFGK